jgi:hypothetical protein
MESASEVAGRAACAKGAEWIAERSRKIVGSMALSFCAMGRE